MAPSEADQLLDQLFRELADGVCLTDGAGIVSYMNPAASRLLEREPSEILGQSICDLLCSRLNVPNVGTECLTRCPLRKGLSEASTFQGTYEIDKPKDVRVRCVRVQTALFDSWEPNKHLTIIQDFRAEMDLERHKEDWRNMIAHDLRTPLTNIFGTLRIIEEGYAQTVFKPGEVKVLANSLRACRRMLDLLNLYLDVAKLDAGLMPVRAKRVELGDLARRCVEEQEVTARERGLSLQALFPPDLSAHADADLLFRVLQNLVGNACKFTPPGGIVEILGRAPVAGKVEIVVRDTGPGIAAADLPRLFDRFFQADARREGKVRGTGLGLAFCREAVRAMKGEIAVESHQDFGSRFSVILPAHVSGKF